MNLWAVIPSRDRPVMLANLIDQLRNDNVNVVVIDTGYSPSFSTKRNGVTWIRDDADPPNISRWWNLGIDYVKTMEGLQEHVVTILNDDLVIPPKFVQSLAMAIVGFGAAAAYPDQHGFGRNKVHTKAGPISLYQRMTGYAFALRGSANLTADETLQWWYGDDDLDWRAREMGGSVLVGGVSVQHLSPNASTVGKLMEQAGRDRHTFFSKWHQLPW